MRNPCKRCRWRLEQNEQGQRCIFGRAHVDGRCPLLNTHEAVKQPDPYAAFFDWCDVNGFKDVGSGSVEDMDPRRFDEATAAYANLL